MIKGCFKYIGAIGILLVVLLFLADRFLSPAPPPTPTPMPVSPWSAIVSTYIGPDAKPTDLELAKSFTAIMGIANTIVMDPEHYTPDEIHRAQVIFDTAGDAHDALFADDSEMLALRWESLNTFVALLKNAGH